MNRNQQVQRKAHFVVVQGWLSGDCCELKCERLSITLVDSLLEKLVLNVPRIVVNIFHQFSYIRAGTKKRASVLEEEVGKYTLFSALRLILCRLLLDFL
jgi:hypothetical protein